MARSSKTPYGKTKSGFVFDSDIREFINTRTGEIVSAADAIPVPTPKTVEYRTGTRSFDYKSRKQFHGDQAVDIIRKQAQQAPRDSIIIVRGHGGTEEYEDDWWSSQPIEAGELADMDDEDIAEYMYGILEDGPDELDIYFREEE